MVEEWFGLEEEGGAFTRLVHGANFCRKVWEKILENDPRRRSRRVTFRVSLRWQNPKTEANRRKRTKESANAKSLALWEFG